MAERCSPSTVRAVRAQVDVGLTVQADHATVAAPHAAVLPLVTIIAARIHRLSARHDRFWARAGGIRQERCSAGDVGVARGRLDRMLHPEATVPFTAILIVAAGIAIAAYIVLPDEDGPATLADYIAAVGVVLIAWAIASEVPVPLVTA